MKFLVALLVTLGVMNVLCQMTVTEGNITVQFLGQSGQFKVFHNSASSNDSDTSEEEDSEERFMKIKMGKLEEVGGRKKVPSFANSDFVWMGPETVNFTEYACNMTVNVTIEDLEVADSEELLFGTSCTALDIANEECPEIDCSLPEIDDGNCSIIVEQNCTVESIRVSFNSEVRIVPGGRNREQATFTLETNFFTEENEFDYGNETIHVDDGTLKFSISIVDWPYSEDATGLEFSVRVQVPGSSGNQINVTDSGVETESGNITIPRTFFCDGEEANITSSVEQRGSNLEIYFFFPGQCAELYYDPVVAPAPIASNSNPGSNPSNPSNPSSPSNPSVDGGSSGNGGAIAGSLIAVSILAGVGFLVYRRKVQAKENMLTSTYMTDQA